MAETLESSLKTQLDPLGVLGQVSRQPNIFSRGKAASQSLEPLMRGEQEAAAETRRIQRTGDEEIATKQLRQAEQAESRATTATTAYERAVGDAPKPPVQQANPNELMELAALTAILGGLAGATGSGRSALAAMEGISEGYKLGKQDVYERGIKDYQASLESWKNNVQLAKNNLDNFSKMEAVKRGSGDAEIKLFQARLKGTVAAAEANRGNIAGAASALQDMIKTRDAAEAKLLTAVKQQTIKTAQVKGSDNKNYLVDVNTFSFGSDPSNVNTKGVIGEAAIKTSEAGSRERTFAQRVFGSIKGMAVDAKNLLTLPSTAAMPEFAGITAEDPNSIFRALIAMTARTITEPEKRAFQQITEQIAFAMANIEGQGLASGATVAKVKAFDSLRPKAGDNAINMAIYFARVRQELETGIEVFLTNTGANEEQKRQAQEILKNLPKQIPFTVEDVFRKVPGSQEKLSEEMNRLVRQSPVLTELESPEQATTQGTREGDESTSRSGKPIVFRNGEWEYK